MKKKIAAVLLLSTLIAGTVSASTINGDYKGNPIVKVRANGVLLDPEVPAQIIDGKTLLPLRDVAAALATEIHWDQNTYSVDLIRTTDSVANAAGTIDVSKMARELKNFGVTYAQVASNGDDFLSLTFFINLNIEAAKDDLYSAIFQKSAQSPSTFTVLQFNDHSLGIASNDIREFLNGNLTTNELSARYFIDGKLNSAVNNADPTSSTSDVVESKIDGDFEGFDDGKLFKLQNGQVWEQIDYTYHYSYKYSPKVLIYKDGTSYKMSVDGVDKKVKVKQIK